MREYPTAPLCAGGGLPHDSDVALLRMLAKQIVTQEPRVGDRHVTSTSRGGDPPPSSGPALFSCACRIRRSGGNGLRRSVFSGYGRTCVESSVGPPRDDEVSVPDAAGARARESGASAAGRGADPDPRATPTPRGVGPSFLGDPLTGVGGLEGYPGDRRARDRDPVASRRLQALLETEEQARTHGTPRAGTARS